MRKRVLLSFILLLSGCSSVKEIHLYEAGSFTTVNEESQTTYTEPDIVEQFATAINDAEQLPGKVDVAEPQYVLELDGESYYLWIDGNTGSVMNTQKTHTLYELEEGHAKEIFETISKPAPKPAIKTADIVESLEKAGLEFEQAKFDSDHIFGMKLNRERPEAFDLGGNALFIYTYRNDEERQKGLEDWHEETVMYNLVTYHVFEVRNVLIFYVYGNEAYTDIHEKIVKGLKGLL